MAMAVNRLIAIVSFFENARLAMAVPRLGDGVFTGQRILTVAVLVDQGDGIPEHPGIAQLNRGVAQETVGDAPMISESGFVFNKPTGDVVDVIGVKKRQIPAKDLAVFPPDSGGNGLMIHTVGDMQKLIHRVQAGIPVLPVQV